MSGISLEGVTKQYPGGVLAVKGVDIDIESGEFVTLVGPSGCGKTTTLRTIAGFEMPTDGAVRIDEDEVTDAPPYERDTGMVFQDFALFPHMTIYENIAYGMEAAGEYTDEEIDARVEEMLELVELPGVADRTPDQLSGGQQQRIALARALAPRPKALLLDEPLASLDKKLREQMQVELRRIQQEIGITTVFVTHNQEEALTMSDRLAVMNDGKFEQVGPPEEVYNDPDSRFVADFLGTANIFDGTVTAVDDGYATVDCEGLTLRSKSRPGVEPGADVSVIVRPERFRFDSASADGGTSTATADVNVFEGEITFKRHLGSSVELRVETPDGRELVVVRRSGMDKRSPGDRVTVAVDAEECRIVEA
ncbi:polyamine ABC transporter ATP-binding protein [Natronorubrum sp. JWXQ-INN-674]|uniref:Molybdate/tungstate import ATP-binding protein WtpC n=1 Tax=Natronorubrum halalkaliphilum TaxID=2691917 RepID=A0A6B0VHV7_9EURY|nr:ABC transporter ATP-binding protein [Natronorubrum halalkaliphilum]MXV60677.1 polyamine ABC transporter ATP-binding protein [Natronorubrum halalkaliphilum]